MKAICICAGDNTEADFVAANKEYVTMSWKFAVKVMAGPKTYIIEAENYDEAFAKARDMLPDEWKRLDDDDIDMEARRAREADFVDGEYQVEED